jgi:AraC-like DNA-binding protein
MVVSAVVRMQDRQNPENRLRADASASPAEALATAGPSDWLTTVVDSCRALVGRQEIGDRRDALRQLARLVETMPPSVSPGERLLVWALVDEVTFFVLGRGVGDARIRGALQFIETHYTEPRLTLGAVAAHVGMSRFHLARTLTTQTGHGFRAHLHGARVRAAERLLRGTTLSVKEVAATVGYNDTTQLCRHFRRFRGTSPARFAARGAPQQRMTNRNN